MASPKPTKPATAGSLRAFIDSAVEAFELDGPIYQFGSFPNGDLGPRARLRDSFQEDACVDLTWEETAEIQRLPLPDHVARTVLCIDALGYAVEPRRMIEEMMRILSPGGTLLVCAPVEAPMPENTSAYWRLTPRGLERLLCATEAKLVGWQGGESFPHTLYGVGFKPPLSPTVLHGINRFLDGFQARIDQQAGRIGWRRRLKQWLAGWVGNRSGRQRRRDHHKLQFAVHFSVDWRLRHDFLQGCFLEGCLPEGQTGTRLDLTQ